MRFHRALSLCFVPACAGPLLLACGSHENSPGDRVAQTEDHLTGGRPALESEYPATVALGCTGVKVGPRHYLLAAHCIHNHETNALKANMAPGSPFDVNPNNNATVPGVTLTVESAHIHPQWFASCVTPCGVNVLSPEYPPDVALVIVEEETPSIPQASIDATTVAVNDAVVMAGYGCEEGLEGPGANPPRLKIEEVEALAASALLHTGSYLSTTQQAEDVAAQYVITPGFFVDSNAASLCFGDSGGPLNREESETDEQLVVGINAYYTFSSGSMGVSTTNWHTRVDVNDRYGVLNWLAGLGVNVRDSGTCSDTTTNGSESDTDCGGSCPNRCSISQACNSHSDCSSGFCDEGTCEAPPAPCTGLCESPVQFSTQSYHSGNLGSGVTCHETSASIAAAACGNFASGRTFLINDVEVTCNGSAVSLPPQRSGGYCFQASAGDHPWAYFNTW